MEKGLWRRERGRVIQIVMKSSWKQKQNRDSNSIKNLRIHFSLFTMKYLGLKGFDILLTREQGIPLARFLLFQEKSSSRRRYFNFRPFKCCNNEVYKVKF